MPKDTWKKCSIYMLRTEWNKDFHKNELGIGDVVQVWSFQVGIEQELCLALVVVSRCGGNGKERRRKNSRGRRYKHQPKRKRESRR
jgi:hypothetical protein